MRGVAMDPTRRARARLFLRSEAAMGQVALPVRKTATTPLKNATKPSNPTQKAAPRSSIALEQAPSDASIDIFVAERPSALPPLAREEKIRLLAQLEEEQVRNCDKCR